ncbi:MAG: hypothetical protein EOO54_12550 [Haliea sp.]|nr:MAG: hypothetical protein EOO54_12550 [Haliea sp.]
MIVGIPLLLGASVVLGVLLAFRPGNRRRAAAIVLFLPTCLYSLYVALDARTLLKDVGSENSLIGLAFFGLFALACLLFYLLVRRPTEGGT